MKLETYITNKNIEDLFNEIKISNILLTIEHYRFYFNPILSHNIHSELFNQVNIQNVKYNKINTLILNKSSSIYMIEKELRVLSINLPLTHKNDILCYLHKTIDLLLLHNIFTPLNNNTIHYDNINKIPIIIDFKNAIIITKWQNKTEFNEKYMAELNELLFTP
jgi:hypothetical protein